ncbi:alpha/beta fold hydrolase [Bacillus salacetis]|uniref:alpha/beta fold hydrolase n=1 Tax=Bacillus salacetis TaxID=2315464 RepID=UPI003BA18213
MECKVKYGTINYKVTGEGRPYIILHSMGTDHRAMEAWLEPIFSPESNCKRIYIDLPAHGLSTINEHFKGTEQIVGNIIEFIQKTIGDQTFGLIGMSYGAYVAQGIMDELGEKVEGIALIVPAVHNPTKNLPEKVVLKQEEKMLKTLDDDMRQAFETLFVIQTDEMVEGFLSELQPGRERANREFLTSDWREKEYFLKKEPFIEHEEITIPALFLMGKQDSICGYEGQFEVFKKFSKATFSVLDGAGHMLVLEKRETAQALIKDWIKEING